MGVRGFVAVDAVLAHRSPALAATVIESRGVAGHDAGAIPAIRTPARQGQALAEQARSAQKPKLLADDTVRSAAGNTADRMLQNAVILRRAVGKIGGRDGYRVGTRFRLAPWISGSGSARSVQGNQVLGK